MESPRFGNSSNSYELAKRAVHQALDVVVHLSHGPGGARRVSGVVALGESVDHAVELYGQSAEGNLRRVSRLVGDLPPRLRARLRHNLAGGELPAA
jgi:hypothetical protein